MSSLLILMYISVYTFYVKIVIFTEVHKVEKLLKLTIVLIRMTLKSLLMFLSAMSRGVFVFNCTPAGPQELVTHSLYEKVGGICKK